MQHAHAGSGLRRFRARWRRIAGGQLHARLRLGDAFGVQRVRAQVRKRAVVVVARRLLQLFKHAGDAAAFKTCIGHHTKANAVGLALHVAGKAQLVLNRQRLAAHDSRAGGVRAFAGGQRTQHHGRHQPRHLPRLLRHQPGNMALRDVAHLMAQHGGQLIAVADSTDQTQMHTEIAPGQRKSVDAAVAQ